MLPTVAVVFSIIIKDCLLYPTAVSETKETIALFKAAWDHAQKHSRSNFGQDLTQTFACSALHVLCKPVQPIACE